MSSTPAKQGDSNWNAAPGVERSFSIGKENQTISFDPLSPATYGDADFPLSATASSGLPVSFGASGDCSLTGANSDHVHITGAGSCTITASQAGDADWNPAPDAQQAFSIAKASATLSFDAATLSQTFDHNPKIVTVTTVPSGLGTVTVTYDDGSGPTTDAPSAVGSYTVGATLDNPNYAADPITDTLTVNPIVKQDQTITFDALSAHTFGDADFAVSATASSGLAVTFGASGPCALADPVTVHLTGAGMCTITAHQAGDEYWNAAPDVAHSFTVSKATTSATVISSVNPSGLGQPVSFTATVTSGAGAPTGSVQFKIDGSNFGAPVALDASGQAVSGSTTTLAAGNRMVRVVYVASANYLGSTSSILTQVVGKASTTTTVESSVNPSSFGQAVSFTATVTSSAGTPTGSVQFKIDGANFGLPVALDASGQAVSGSTTTLNVGNRTVRAYFLVSANYAASTSGALTQVVGKAATTTTVASSVNPSSFGQAVSFTATVTSAFGTPTGSVQFKIDGSNFGSPVALDASGQAVSGSTTTLNVGNRTVRAYFLVSTNYAASTSGALTQVVSKAATTTTVASSVNPSSFGQAVSFTATVTSAFGTPTGSVQFKIDGSNFGTPVALDASGQAVSGSTTTLSVGNHNVRAVYVATSNYLTAQSNLLVQRVNRAS